MTDGENSLNRLLCENEKKQNIDRYIDQMVFKVDIQTITYGTDN